MFVAKNYSTHEIIPHTKSNNIKNTERLLKNIYSTSTSHSFGEVNGQEVNLIYVWGRGYYYIAHIE